MGNAVRMSHRRPHNIQKEMTSAYLKPILSVADRNAQTTLDPNAVHAERVAACAPAGYLQLWLTHLAALGRRLGTRVEAVGGGLSEGWWTASKTHCLRNHSNKQAVHEQQQTPAGGLPRQPSQSH